MKIKIFQLIIILLFVFVFIIFYKGLKNSNIYVPKVNIDKEIPQFSAKLFNRPDYIDSEEFFKGDEFYLLNIWASWCVPCREEHIYLKILSNEKNLKLIGLNYKDNLRNANSFLEELGNPYNVIFLDQNGTISIEWGAYGVPETYLIKKNRIIKKVIGPLNKNLVIQIKDLIK